MAQLIGVLLLGVGLFAGVVWALRQLAKSADQQKCREDCFREAEEYCDCGGWPFVPERHTNA